MIKKLILLLRPPFHLVGIFPFLLGSFLAYRLTGAFDLPIFITGLLAVILIMSSTYLAGEYFDFQGDVLSAKYHTNPFAGGSRILLSNQLPKHLAFRLSIICIALALILGFALQFGMKTGPYTLPLGALGGFLGFFYSTEPIRLVKRGLGEIAIGFCYGWLPVAVGYYIQTGNIDPIVHILSLPVGFTIFNVILLNEFPDYEADIATGKKNLLTRIGKKRGKMLYIILNILSSLIVFVLPLFGVPLKGVLFYLPLFLISILIVKELLEDKETDAFRLSVLCGLNIALNLGTTGALILAYI